MNAQPQPQPPGDSGARGRDRFAGPRPGESTAGFAAGFAAGSGSGSEAAAAAELAPQPPAQPPAQDEPQPVPDVDLLAMDLAALRTTEHPVLAELLADLRQRVAAPGSETLWAFDNVSTPSPRP